MSGRPQSTPTSPAGAYVRATKFAIARALKPSYYGGYHHRRRELAGADLPLMSGQYLRRLLSFVRTRNRYYARVGADSEGLQQWPVLTKEIIRNHFEELRSTGTTGRVYANSSGGSSGNPVTVIQDHNYMRWSARTHEYYFRQFLDVEWNCTRNLWLWGSDRDLKKLRSWKTRGGMFLRNRVMLNSFETDDSTWLRYIDEIECYRPHFVAGYAGSLYQMAIVARKYNKKLYKPQFVYSSAELLQGFMRSAIEEQFDTRVYDFYGSREVGAIAGECKRGRRHVFTMNNIVEVLDGFEQPVREGEEGQLVITNLHNLSMPMIRYAIGDMGSVRFGVCECGSRLPVLEKLRGRVTDHFRRRDGGLIHGEYFTHLFYHRNWVEQFQVDQLEYDRVQVSLVKRGTPNEGDILDIVEKIRAVMGERCVVRWKHVNSIERTAEGKRLYTRCLLEK